jgi:hypothetical protein
MVKVRGLMTPLRRVSAVGSALSRPCGCVPDFRNAN